MFTRDDLNDLEDLAGGDPVALRDRARRLLRLLEDGGRVEGQTPVDSMVTAAEWLHMAGDQDAAEQVLLDATSLGGPADIDPRAMLCYHLLQRDDLERARELSAQLRKDRSVAPGSYLLTGEAWEMTGNLKEATRWFTMGLLRSDGDVSGMAQLLGMARHRVRRAQGLPLDATDLEFAPAPDVPAPDLDAPVATPPAVRGRREPCHCGSGRRYKNCHGRGTTQRTVAPYTPMASTPIGSDGQYSYHLDIVRDDPTPE